MAVDAEVAAVLRASVSRRPEPMSVLAQRLSAHDPTALAAAAVFHGIAGYVHEATRDVPAIPTASRDALDGSRKRTVLAHLRTLADLAFLREVLDAAHVPWLVVKGPTLAAPVHGRVELRSYGDLDALVPAADLHRALDALEAAGCEVLDHNWTLIRQQMKGEVHLRLPSGTALDLHWHLLNERSVRTAFTVPIDDLFARRRTVRIDGVDVPTLASPDTVVYVGLHAILSGGHRLIWLKDVERLLASEDVDPGAIASAARSWSAELPLRTVLDRVDAAIGLPPAGHETRRTLAPARLWSALGRLAWQAAPAERQDGSGSFGRMVARSVRTTQSASFRTLLAKAGSNVRDGGWRDAHAIRRRRDPTDPGSGRFASGGQEERRRYLDAVAGDDSGSQGR